MNKDEKIDAVIENSLQIFEIIHNKNHALASKLGITIEQFHLLLEIHEMIEEDDRKIPPTIGEIAERMNNAQNTVSEKITRMVKKNLVNRYEDETDRRINRVTLTEEGHKILHQIEQQATKNILKDLISKIDDHLIDEFLKGLTMITSELKNK